MLQRINPDLDEGQSGDFRNLQLAIVRSLIRQKIERPDGLPNWSKANQIAQARFMCAQTVINFAYGDTKRPSPWTLKSMVEEADFELVLVPRDADRPVGSIDFS